jgi:hypothetical protein
LDVLVGGVLAPTSVHWEVVEATGVKEADDITAADSLLLRASAERVVIVTVNPVRRDEARFQLLNRGFILGAGDLAMAEADHCSGVPKPGRGPMAFCPSLHLMEWVEPMGDTATVDAKSRSSKAVEAAPRCWVGVAGLT